VGGIGIKLDLQWTACDWISSCLC